MKVKHEATWRQMVQGHTTPYRTQVWFLAENCLYSRQWSSFRVANHSTSTMNVISCWNTHALVEYSKLIKSTSACLSQMKLRIPQWNRYYFDINARKVQNTNFQKQRNVLKGNLHLDNAKQYYILDFKKLFCNWKYVQKNEQQMNVQIKP